MKRIRYDLELAFIPTTSTERKLYDASWVCNVTDDEYEKALQHVALNELPSLSIIELKEIRNVFSKEKREGTLNRTYKAFPVDGVEGICG